MNDMPSSPPRPRPETSLTGSLPVPLSSFLGRASEIESIAQLVQQPDVRLVSLVGPGGVGKTRLGLQVADGALRLSGTLTCTSSDALQPVFLEAEVTQRIGRFIVRSWVATELWVACDGATVAWDAVAMPGDRHLRRWSIDAMEADDLDAATTAAIDIWSLAKNTERPPANHPIADEFNEWLDATIEAWDLISDGLIHEDVAELQDGFDLLGVSAEKLSSVTDAFEEHSAEVEAINDG